MKLTIGSLDDHSLDVEAQYNPKDLELAKQIGWKDHNAIAPRLDLEYTGAPGRTLALELLFDGFEQNASVEPVVKRLHEMSSPRDASSKNELLRRPHACVVVWNEKEIPKFECVIESLAIKYTMFSKSGRPLRAVCQVKLKEAKLRSR